MYFLNGERIYISPESSCKTPEEQLKNCLQQLLKINSGKKVFKINFFVDTYSRADYVQIQQKIHDEVNIHYQNMY